MTTELATEFVTASVGHRPSSWISTGFSRQRPLSRSIWAVTVRPGRTGPPPAPQWRWDSSSLMDSPCPPRGTPRDAVPGARGDRRARDHADLAGLRALALDADQRRHRAGELRDEGLALLDPVAEARRLLGLQDFHPEELPVPGVVAEDQRDHVLGGGLRGDDREADGPAVGPVAELDLLELLGGGARRGRLREGAGDDEGRVVARRGARARPA